MASMIVDLLGGEHVLGRGADARWVALLRAGLPYPALESMMRTLGLSRAEVSGLLALPLRTLARRKRQHRLDPLESDRLFRVAKIAAEAAELFESKTYAAEWLRRSNTALGGLSPLSLLDTEAGEVEVAAVLGRLKYGGYS